jgi:hypothetical protein
MQTQRGRTLSDLVRMCKQSVLVHLISALACSIGLVVLVCAPATVLAQAQVRTDRLFLLAGTPTFPFMLRAYPVTLYGVNPHQKLQRVRQIVPLVPREEQEGRGGSAFVREDMEGRIYVVFNRLQPTTVSIIHERQPTLNDELIFYPDGAIIFNDSLGVAAGVNGASYLLVPILGHPQGITGVQASLLTVAGDPTSNGNRVTQSDWFSTLSSDCLFPCATKEASARQTEWFKYQSFRYQGAPGGPTSPGYIPLGKLLHDRVVIPGPDGTWIPLDSIPPGFPKLKITPAGPTISVVAATDRFFACALTILASKALGREGPETTSVYVHNRMLNTWKEIKSAATVHKARRIFGPWLATIVEMWTTGEGNPDNPGRENERNYETDSLPNIRQLYSQVAAKETSIPGILLLDNLEDGRRITIDTGQEDSEILTVREDGLLLYRVNDSILAAQIEGDRLGKPILVVKDEDVPEVHWVFWSPSDTNPNLGAQSTARQ